MLTEYELVLRLVLSAVIGGLIGMEREANNRPAGLRTHILVTLGSTLIMLLSTQAFSYPQGTGDPARLAAQVVSGIGFLGAGTILRNGNTIRGLTTAATIWVCGGLGLAIGVGYYTGALITAVIVLVSLTGLGRVEKKVLSKKYNQVIVKCGERPGLLGDIGHVFGKSNMIIKSIQIFRNSEDSFEFGDYKVDDIVMGGNEGSIEIHFLVKICQEYKVADCFENLKNIKGVSQVIWGSINGN